MDRAAPLLGAIPRERSLEPVVLTPLPPSGLLRSAEIRSASPAAVENRALRRMVDVPRPLLRATNSPPAPE